MTGRERDELRKPAAERVRIFGEEYEIKAGVKSLYGFSAHADAKELATMTKPLAERVKQAYLVHGEEDQAEVMIETMTKQGYRDVNNPQKGQKFELT